MGRKIAYVMSRFPHLPETFILREMNELERQGWTIALYPLVRQKQGVIHEEARPWLERVRYDGFLSGRVLRGNVQALARHPVDYFHLWGKMVSQNRRNPNLLLRALALFPKAVVAAADMQAEGITHIHAHYATHPALFAWIIHQLTGITYSITVHAHDIFVRTAMLATKLRSASFIAAISEYNRNYLAQKVGPWVGNKTHIEHCGITPEQYRPRTAPAQPEELLDIINVGSLQPYKGQRYLIEACALLRAQGIPLRCRIIGGGEEQKSLQTLIEQHQLSTQVQLLGPLPQEKVAALLPTANCYVQPSVVTPSGKMEGIPVALMEALACRLPVVATNLSGVPELVRSGETGLLVPPADASALATALATVYATPAESFALATAGYELVRQDFHLQKNVSLLADLLTQHVERPLTASQVIFRALEPPINSDLWPGSKLAPVARKDEK